MTSAHLATRGMTLIEQARVKVNNQAAQLIKVKQFAAGLHYLKWLLVFGDASNSVTVVGTYPATQDANMGAKIKTALLTTVWNKNAVVDLFDGLSFRIGETDELKHTKRISNMVILGRKGKFGKIGADQPFLIVGTAISPLAISDVAIFSKQRILHTAQVEDINIVAEKPINIVGHDAYELVAHAQHSKHQKPVVVYQVIIPEGDSYFMLQGRVGQANASQYLRQFRQLANSVTLGSQ